MGASPTSSHHLSHAERLFRGDVDYPPYGALVANRSGRRGVEMPAVQFVDLGAPIATDDDNIVDAATGAELPNAETVTYTAATDGTSPLDNPSRRPTTTIKFQGQDVLVWSFDVPRAIRSNVTHGASVVAMTITVTGYDEYFEKVVEDIAVAAGGTSQVDNGLKAFKYIESIAYVAAGNAETNTANLGFNDVFGLPFKVANANKILVANADGSVEDFVIVVGDATAATATTGDVRGTVDPTTAANGTVRFGIMMALENTRVKNDVFGVAQFGG